MKYYLFETKNKFSKTIIYINQRYKNLKIEKIDQFCDFNLIKSDKFKIFGHYLNDKNIELNCSLQYNNKILMKEWYLLFIQLITTLVLSTLYLKYAFFLIITIASLFFMLVFASFFNIVIFSQLNLTVYLPTLIILVILSVSDTHIWSFCYTKRTATHKQKLKQQQQQQQQKISTLDKLLIGIITHVYYYLMPKAILFIIIFIVSFTCSKISTIKLHSIYAFGSFFLYFLSISLFYSTFFLLFSKLNFFKYFNQLLKLKAKIGTAANNILTNHLAEIIFKYRFLWVLMFTCASIVSFLIIFYAPRLYAETNIFKIKNEGEFEEIDQQKNISFYIVWNFDFKKNMLLYQNNHNFYIPAAKICNNLLNYTKIQENDDDDSNKYQYLLDQYYYYKNMKKFQVNNISSLWLSISGNTNEFKSFECLLENQDINENNSIILTQNASVLIFKIETNIKYTQNFLSMQKIYKIIENWWLNETKEYNITDDMVWWSSEQFNQYAIQHELGRTLILSLSIPFIFIFLCVFLITRNFFTTGYVTLNIFLIELSTISLTVWLDWRIDAITCFLYLFVMIIATHYCLLYAIFSCIIFNLKNTIKSIGIPLLLTTINYVLSAIPLLFSSTQILKQTGTIIVLSSILSYLFAIFLLQSLLVISDILSYVIKDPLASNLYENTHTNKENERTKVSVIIIDSIFLISFIFFNRRVCKKEIKISILQIL